MILTKGKCMKGWRLYAVIFCGVMFTLIVIGFLETFNTYKEPLVPFSIDGKL
jgi:hypothetical protein